MELISIVSEPTGLQTFMALVMFFSGFSIILLGVFSALDWNEEGSIKLKIGFVVLVVIFLSVMLLPDWTPKLAYYYHVKDHTQLEQYVDTHYIYKNEIGFYKLVEK